MPARPGKGSPDLIRERPEALDGQERLLTDVDRTVLTHYGGEETQNMDVRFTMMVFEPAPSMEVIRRSKSSTLRSRSTFPRTQPFTVASRYESAGFLDGV